MKTSRLNARRILLLLVDRMIRVGRIIRKIRVDEIPQF